MVQQNQTDITNELLKSITKRNFVDIQYKKKDDIKYFWIGIKKINVEARTLYVFGFNVGTKQRTDFDYPISLDSIIYAQCIDETYFETEESKDLINDIIKNPDKYSSIFNGRTENLKILDYLDECVQLNNIPYIPDEKLTLLDGIDNKRLKFKTIRLNDEEFEEIVEKLDKNLFKKKKVSNNTKTLYLCLNILSIIKNDKKKMYVLAYKKLSLDIKNQSLVADDEITFCKTFGIKNEDNNKEEIQQYEINEYLDNGDQYLLDDYEKNQETIKDIINNKIPSKWKVDDEPYIFPMQRKLVFNLKKEISAILKMQQENNYTPPIQAFLGKLISFPSKEKETPIVLLDENTNLDQLVAIENAMNDPVSYVQGPPGTGKTSTIVNIILTAFFNNKTVLFTSYNNKPINGVVDKLSKITYKNRQPLFPFIVVGRKDYIPDNLAKVKELLEIANKETVLEDLLETKKGQEIEKTKKISQLLQKYREKQDLENRIDVLEPLMEYTKDSFQFNIIFSGTESTRLQKELESMETIDCASTVALINENKNDFFMYMYFKSVQHLQMLNNDDYEDFRKILYIEDKDEQCKAFNNYLAEDENIIKLQKVFPVFLSTCISSRRIGNPEPFFDITIMDEAGQCDTATSLVPILRGKNLLLVGDPQQLNPVVNLDKAVDEKLKKLYKVPETYDFLNNSIYKTYVSNDHISSETLLSHHYRCAPKIIRFNNKKYYNNKLVIETKDRDSGSLSFISIPKDESIERNQAPLEIDYIKKFVKENNNKSIGIITPFRAQKDKIISCLKDEGIDANGEGAKVSCGTVHSFQGDEKDVILFSLAITNRTSNGTYHWLKSNRELINVATSRAKDSLILMGSEKDIERLHEKDSENDDLFELYNYVKENGDFDNITQLGPKTVACGMRPYLTETEKEFMQTLSQALTTIDLQTMKIRTDHECPLTAVFNEDGLTPRLENYYKMARFDFVVFDITDKNSLPIPLLAFEIDGIEHETDEVVKSRDKKKQELSDMHNFPLIHVKNAYARRYEHVKKILEDFFAKLE